METVALTLYDVWGQGENEGERATLRSHKKRPVVWQLIHENIYTHRQVKVQDEDDVMLCHCKLPSNGGPACGTECINRVLNMECVAVSRPVGNGQLKTDRSSNLGVLSANLLPTLPYHRLQICW
jgi:hypothetical protein